MTPNKSLVNLVSIALIGGAAGKLFQYLINIVIGRNFGPDALGVFAFGMVILTIGTTIGKAGLDSAAKKYTAIYARRDEWSRLSGVVLLGLGVSIAFGAFIGILIYSILTFLEQSGFWTVDSSVYIVLLGVPLFAFMTVGMAATTGFLETKYMVYIKDLGQSGSALVLVVVVTLFFATIDAILLAYVISILVGCVLSVVFLSNQGAIGLDITPQFEPAKIIGYSLPLMFASIISSVANWFDIIMLEIFTQSATVGLYQAAFQTAIGLGFLLASMNTIFPSIAADLYHNDRDRLNDFYVSVTKWISYFTILGFLFIVIHSREILGIFGPQFKAAWPALIILAGNTSIAALTGPASYLLSMSQYERIEFVNSVVLMALNFTLNLVLIPRYGLLGAAVATTISLSLVNFLRLGETWRFLAILPPIIQFRPETIWKGGAAMFVSVSIMLALRSIQLPDIHRVLLSGAISLLVFTGLIYALGLSQRDRLLLESMF